MSSMQTSARLARVRRSIREALQKARDRLFVEHFLSTVLTTLTLVLLIQCGCGGGGGAGESSSGVPEGFPDPRYPAENLYSEQKATLGRHLFYDKRLSLNETQSCASCHVQARAFTDGRQKSVGSTGERHPRNSPSLANVAYQVTLNWANPLVTQLERQFLMPLFSTHPIELGFAGQEDILLARLTGDATYQRLFDEAFPGETISLVTMGKALATFQRKIMSGNSPYDQYVYQGNDDALSPSAKRGLDLFFSERLECDHCHGGLNFSSATTHAGETRLTQPQFENNGLYNIDGRGAYPPDNRGLFEITGIASDMGKFKPPTLRNIEVTAPYMHDGSIQTLEEVIAHYARGGRVISSGPYRGDGARSPVKSPLVSGFRISEEETQDLLSFLRSLTDSELLSRCDLSDPFDPDRAC